jgi:hypothetical protein
LAVLADESAAWGRSGVVVSRAVACAAHPSSAA